MALCNLARNVTNSPKKVNFKFFRAPARIPARANQGLYHCLKTKQKTKNFNGKIQLITFMALCNLARKVTNSPKKVNFNFFRAHARTPARANQGLYYCLKKKNQIPHFQWKNSINNIYAIMQLWQKGYKIAKKGLFQFFIT